MPLRTFKCKICGESWQTDKLGRFTTCDSCKERSKLESHDKLCVECKKPFFDTSSRNCTQYCSEICQKRAKGKRVGLPEGYFLFDRELLCATPGCGVKFTPSRANQIFCSVECRDSTQPKPIRDKLCEDCGESFYDNSLNNNRRSHERCPNRPVTRIGFSKPNRLEIERNARVMSGGGRIDQIETIPKYSSTWWGRVGELIFTSYRPEAQDVNVTEGGLRPYDFIDPKLGRINVKTTRGRLSPENRLMWSFQLNSAKEKCDYAFLIGYAQDVLKIEYIWMIPKDCLNQSLMRMAPGSKDYQWARYDLTEMWGVEKQSSLLREFVGESFSYDEAKEMLPRYQGRRGECLYSDKYPLSKDMNLLNSLYPYDFEDSDGIKVNVKTSKPHLVESGKIKWSFTLLSPKKIRKGHQCDLYSCICLDDTGTNILSEYRIPVSDVGTRTAIHIYDSDKSQWAPYLVKS